MADLNDIAQFVRVAELGSFTAAGRSLGLPKASVSRRILRLEAALGVRLFHRSTRQLRLTDQGEQYLATVGPALASVETAGSVLLSAQNVPRGRIRIWAPVGLGDHFLIDHSIAFLRRFEGTEIELILADHDLNMIANRIDLAFKIGTAFPDSSLVARRLAPTRKVLVASPAFLKGRTHPKTLADLADHECIVLGDRLSDRHWTLSGPEGTATVSVRARLAATTTQSVLSAAEAGLGIALLPEALVDGRIAAGMLVPVLRGHCSEEAALFALYPSKRQVPAAVTAFVEAVEKGLRARRSR